MDPEDQRPDEADEVELVQHRSHLHTIRTTVNTLIKILQHELIFLHHLFNSGMGKLKPKTEPFYIVYGTQVQLAD